MTDTYLVLWCRYFADLVIGYLQQVLADMLLETPQSAEPAQKLPPPLFSGNEIQGNAICLKGEDLKGAVVKSTVRALCLLSLLPCVGSFSGSLLRLTKVI